MCRHFKSGALIFLIAFLSGMRTFAQQDKKALINTFINDANRSGLFNGNILVADHGKVVLKKAAGYAEASKKDTLSTRYRFHIGSIAKEFDAVGIMMLRDQGKLGLNDKVSVFFPELPAWAEKISVKNLLQYTSGLPEVKYKTVHSDADNWKDLMSLQKLDFEPGSTYAYNNNNTFLRRRIIEKVMGVSFDQFVQQHILKSAGINDGVIDPKESDPLVARSFNNDFKQDGLEVPISGWTCLNLDDFFRWSQSVNNFSLINPSSTAEILVPVGRDKQSGLGGGQMKNGRVSSHIHDGSGLHYQALVLYDAAKQRTIVILSNQKQGNLYQIAASVQAILDNKSFQKLSDTGSR